MIDGKKFFNQPVKSNMRTLWDDYTTGCLLDYNYFNNYYKMVATDLSKQQALVADPKATQQINFTRNLDWAEGEKMFFIIGEAKETVLDFSQGTVKVLWMCSTILFCSI